MFSNFELYYVLLVVGALVLSVPIHETAHGLAARWLGDKTAEEAGRLSLNPLKHVDIWLTILLPTVMLLLHYPPIFVAKPVPFDPRYVRYGEFGAALVGLAGPFSNLLLALVAAAVARLLGVGMQGLGEALSIFVAVNVSLFVFNMLPIPPLDGSRLLYAFAPEPVQQVMAQFERAGFGITIFVLLLLSPLYGPVVRTVTDAILTFLLL